MQNLDVIDINDEQAYDAKLLASLMSTPQKRKRGMIDMLGISCAINYLHAKRFRIDTKRSVYKIPMLFEEFKISDIYYGNYRIDVITLYKEKTIKIPKIHVDMDIMPHFYFIVQIGSKIKEAKMVGFIESRNVLKCSHDSKYYYPTLDLLLDINKFSQITKKSIATKTLLGKHIDCLGLFLKFIDNDLSSVYKRQMINHLMNCDSCRSTFIDTIEFERLANNIRFYPELIRRIESKTPIIENQSELSAINRMESFEKSLEKVDIAKPIEDNETFIDVAENKKEINESPKTVQMFDIQDSKQNKKNTINAIFNDINKIDLTQIKAISGAKTRRALLTILTLVVVLGSFIIISFNGSNDVIEENQNIEEMEEFNEFGQNSYDDFNTKTLTPPPKEILTDDFTIKRPNLSKPTYSPTVADLSWEAPESLVRKGQYTKYLQLVGKNVKLNLQNDLLLVNDIPINKTVKVDINISSSGTINSVKISNSSGSVSIDKSISKVINETLTYMKPPSHGLGVTSFDVTLVLEIK